MKTKLWAIYLILFCALLTSTAQILWKTGSKTLSINTFLTNIPLMIGFFLYAIAAITLIISLRYGELSVLYPFFSTSYVWVSLLSIYFLNEAITGWKWVGIAMIILGICFIGVGSRNGN